MSNAYEKLKILCETTFEDFPEESIKFWIEEILKDYEELTDNYTRVLCHATFGRMSKPYLDVATVCSVIDDAVEAHVLQSIAYHEEGSSYN